MTAVGYLGLVCAIIAYKVCARLWRYYISWVNVPVVGGKGYFGTRRAARSWVQNSTQILQEGYEKHRDFAFQVRTQHRWEVCICNEDMVREYQALPDEIMSLDASNELLFETRYTSPGFADSLPHVPVAVLSKALVWARGQTTASDTSYFQDLVAEQRYGLEAEIDISEQAWCRFNCIDVGLRLMLRMISRVLVGTPLCRDPAAIDLFTRYGSSVPVSGGQIACLPSMLKPLLGPYFPASHMQRELSRLIAAQILEGRNDKPPKTVSDWMWQWVQHEADGKYTALDVARLIVSAIFGSVHSAGMVLSSCLYEMSLRPEYIEPMRREVEQAIHKHGKLDKEAIESMTKLDSFIKECQRWRPLTPSALMRQVKQDYTFKNGLKLPKGTSIISPNRAVLFDEQYYEDPHAFKGFRFHELGQSTGRQGAFKIAGSSPKSRQFGDGRHTCPGKQLAADMLRLILAHFLVNFEIADSSTQLTEEYPPFGQSFMSIKRRESVQA